MSVRCIIRSEGHNRRDSDGAGDADAGKESATFLLYIKKEHLQTTKHKNTNQSNLASKIDMQLPNHRNWQAEDHNISEERQGSVDSAADSLVFTLSVWGCLVVEEGNWVANVEVDDESGNSPADRISHVGPSEHLEFLGWEETHVEEQNGSFDTNQCWCICSLECETDLPKNISHMFQSKHSILCV